MDIIYEINHRHLQVCPSFWQYILCSFFRVKKMVWNSSKFENANKCVLSLVEAFSLMTLPLIIANKLVAIVLQSMAWFPCSHSVYVFSLCVARFPFFWLSVLPQYAELCALYLFTGRDVTQVALGLLLVTITVLGIKSEEVRSILVCWFCCQWFYPDGGGKLETWHWTTEQDEYHRGKPTQNGSDGYPGNSGVPCSQWCGWDSLWSCTNPAFPWICGAHSPKVSKQD